MSLLYFYDTLFELLTSRGSNKELADLKLRVNNINDTDTVHFASRAILVHLKFDSKRETARAFKSKLVGPYMRITFAVPEHREYMRTGYPSESCLVEAAPKALRSYVTPFEITSCESLSIWIHCARGAKRTRNTASVYYCSA